MGSCSQAERHDTPWLIGEAVPSEAAMIEDIVVGFEDTVRYPVIAHELPDVFDRVELRAFSRHVNCEDAELAFGDRSCRVSVTADPAKGCVSAPKRNASRNGITRDIQAKVFERRAFRSALTGVPLRRRSTPEAGNLVRRAPTATNCRGRSSASPSTPPKAANACSTISTPNAI